MAKKYDEKSIERFAGLAGIRQKPTVYIGPTDSNGLWTIFREPADNAVDQALAGRNKLVHLLLDGDKHWIIDAGPGIPVGKKEFEDERGRKEKLSTLYVTTGLTHGGSHFSGDEISRGTHGIGIKATNALSTYFKVWTHREGSWHAIEYAKGKLIKDVHKSAPPKLPHKVKVKGGTVVCFVPDKSLFSKGAKLDLKDVAEWAQLTAYLVPNFKVLFTNSKGKTQEFIAKRGVADFIDKRIADLKCTTLGKTFTFDSKELDVAIVFSDAEGNGLVSAYTNGLLNVEGGEHVRAVQDALVKSLAPYKGKLEYTPSDLRDGLLGLINYKIAAPQFNNQRKDKLLDGRVYSVAYKQMLDAWEAFWNKNKGMAKSVVQRAADLRKMTASFQADKKLIKNIKEAKRQMPAKLADIVGNAPINQRELFLVEGDSASGPCKIARDKNTQAVFSLRGKPLNVMETTADKVNNNEEVIGILAAIGIDTSGKSNDIRYGRIILLADADVDGFHINTLLLGLFWKYTPFLFKQGKICLMDTPRFLVRHKNDVTFGHDKDELRKKYGEKAEIVYLKGLGELDAEPLQRIAFNHKTRKLIQVGYPTSRKERENFERLLGKNADYRKLLLGIMRKAA